MADRKPVIPRRAAVDDIDSVIAHYRDAAGPDVAVAFVDALEQAFDRLSRHPGLGSPRLAGELNLPGLRICPLASFPHVVFSVERADHVDVWRVLHGRRDIPDSLRPETDE